MARAASTYCRWCERHQPALRQAGGAARAVLSAAVCVQADHGMEWLAVIPGWPSPAALAVASLTLLGGPGAATPALEGGAASVERPVIGQGHDAAGDALGSRRTFAHCALCAGAGKRALCGSD